MAIEYCCREIALRLGVPPDQISREMVFRSIYHYTTALQNDYKGTFIDFLADKAKLMGIVKKVRNKAPAFYLFHCAELFEKQQFMA